MNFEKMAENTASEPTGADEQTKPASERPKLSGGILVSTRQKGNPILKFVRNVPWEFTESIVPGKIIIFSSGFLDILDPFLCRPFIPI